MLRLFSGCVRSGVLNPSQHEQVGNIGGLRGNTDSNTQRFGGAPALLLNIAALQQSRNTQRANMEEKIRTLNSVRALEETLKDAWPWASAFLRYLRQTRPIPFHGSHLMFGSDYSGDHGKSPFRVYGFLIADEDASPQWPVRCHSVREKYLKDGRRMSFKNMNDIQRRRALTPFFQAAEYLEGHVVVVAVTKQLRHMSSAPTSMQIWHDLHGLQAKWDSRAFEQMARVSHFFSMFVGAWSSHGMDITWITDDDSIVANPGRLDDMHKFAARLSGFYVPHHLAFLR
jgi:hypothetical protein